jgi:hypothetical protein
MGRPLPARVRESFTLNNNLKSGDSRPIGEPLCRSLTVALDQAEFATGGNPGSSPHRVTDRRIPVPLVVLAVTAPLNVIFC